MRVHPSYLNCVFFVGFMNKKDEIKFVGTAFLIARENRAHQYLVTANHVIAGIKTNSKDGKVLLRVNGRNNSIETFETHSVDWLASKTDSTIDVSVYPWHLKHHAQIDYMLIPESILIRDGMKPEPDVNIGDDVFLTGLFVSHLGQKRNVPVIRMGTISMMPGEPVSTKCYGDIEAYLVELHSTGGLSGSPVFVRGALPLPENTFMLGLIHGHWDSSKNSAQDINVSDQFGEQINMGMAIVVPSSKILTVVNENAVELGLISNEPVVLTEEI